MPNGSSGSVVIDVSMNTTAIESAINMIVADVDNKMKDLAGRVDGSVTKMEQSFARLKTVFKDDNTSKNQKEQQSVSSLTQSYDALAQGMKNVATASSTNWSVLKQYDEQILQLRQQLVAARNDIDLYRQAIGSGKPSMVSWGQEGLREAERNAERLMATLTQLESQRKNLVNVLNPGDSFRNYVDSLTKANPELAQLNAQYRQGVTLMGQQVELSKQQTNEVQKQRESVSQTTKSYSDEIRRLAQELRQYQSVFDTNNPSRSIRFASTQGSTLRDAAIVSETYATDVSKALPYEEQLLRLMKEKNLTYEQLIQLIRAGVAETQRMAQEQSKIGTSTKSAESSYKTLKQTIADALSIQQSEVRTVNLNTGSYTRLDSALRQAQQAYANLSRADRESSSGQNLLGYINRLKTEVRQLKGEANRPVSLEAALGIRAESLDMIAYKIQQLQSYKMGLNITDPKQVEEMKQVENAINKLNKEKERYMGQNEQVVKSNNALTRSFNYMKNRLAFYFTVGASTQFVKNLINVRAQYELLEKSIGILVGSMQEGSRIFSELNAMAIKSPFTTMELGQAAKQLTAYDIAAKDVVNTTKRLADMAAAVGVPIERLSYALGQVKAYEYLNARDARMFANAGIPLVKELSNYYTELEGHMVSVGDVYARMKKRMISYNDTMAVVNKMTDEGGKFFNFQAKQAGTLKVQLANLQLAWNNMLNDIGKNNQSVLTAPITALKSLFKSWHNISNVLSNVAISYGIVKLAQIAYISYSKNVGSATAVATATNWKFVNSLVAMREGLVKVVSSPMTWWMLLVTVILSITTAFDEAVEGLENFNKAIREGSKENAENITKFLNDYSKIIERLNDSDVAKSNPISQEESVKTWEAIKEQIELTSGASDIFISQLTSIQDINERLRKSFDYLETIKSVSSALEKVGKYTIKIQQDWSKWWNANLLPDSMVENVQEYTRDIHYLELAYKRANGEQISFSEHFDAWVHNALYGTEEMQKVVGKALGVLKDNLDDTYESMQKFIDEKKWGANPDAINEFFGQIGKNIVKEGLDKGWQPEDVFRFQLEFEEYRSKAAKQALEKRIQEEKNLAEDAEDEKTQQAIIAQAQRDQAQLDNWEKTNGRVRVLWHEFTKWMENEHSCQVREMYNKMTKNGKNAIDYQSDEWKEFVEKMSTQFAQENKLSQDDTFKHLKQWVNDANKWKIFIELFIGTGDQTTIYDTLTEADKVADEAYGKVKRLGQEIDRLKSKQKGADAVQNRFLESQIEDTTKEQTKAQQEYNEALERGGRSRAAEADAKKKVTAANRANAAARREQAKAESELQKALRSEIQILDKAQKAYNDLVKSGMSRQDALKFATTGFEESIRHINSVLKKYNLAEFDLSKYAGVQNPREILNMFNEQLQGLLSNKFAKPEEIQELQAKVETIKLEAEKFDLKKITDGLNNELGKIKEEYELSVELDANPELADMFIDMFGIDVDELPRTFGEAYDRSNKVAIEKLKKLEKDTKGFDLMSTDILKYGESQGLGADSQPIQELLKWQKTYRDAFKKNITETEKMLDDYVKKYGDYSDKVAEIESNRLEKIKKLNEAYYTESMRKTSEYRTKLNAIDKGAEREKGSAMFDEFKNSRLYVTMFENLQFVSTATLKKIREKLVDLRDEMGNLSPEQLKQVVQQFEKIDKELSTRSPFGSLIKNIKNYREAMGKAGKDAEKQFIQAQENYDEQLKTVAALKEQLEQKKAQAPHDWKAIMKLNIMVALEDEKLKKLKEELETAQALNDKYNMMKQVFKEQWQSIGKIAQVVGANLKSLGELRDTLEHTFGIDLGSNINGVIDGLMQVGDAMNSIVSSATSGNVVGVVTGTINLFAGIGDAVASIFGDGAARTKRLNKQIEESQDEVRKLNMAYKDLERTVNKAMGSQETAAQRALIANKKAELAEIERQLRLEKQKRSKDQDEDAIKQYEETIQSLQHDIEDLGDAITENLLGSNVKAAAEEFVDTWVSAWKEGENTLDAIQEKMDDVIMNLIKKAIASKIVGTLLQPFYDAVDQFASETSQGGVELTLEELKQLAEMAGTLGVNINDALTALFANFERLGIVDKSGKNAELSALQQGIQGITEDTASALEAYMNGVSQQVYYQSDILTQIRDILINFGGDVTIATNAQILFELQQATQIQMSIQSILQGWSNASGLAVRVELAN